MDQMGSTQAIKERDNTTKEKWIESREAIDWENSLNHRTR